MLLSLSAPLGPVRMNTLTSAYGLCSLPLPSHRASVIILSGGMIVPLASSWAL